MKAFVVEHYGKDGLRAADVPESRSARVASKTTGSVPSPSRDDRALVNSLRRAKAA